MHAQTVGSGRIKYLDFLKFIGLMCVIIAHAGPPEWLFMMRNFDVPLMVIISSILGQKSFQKCKHIGSGSIYFCVDRAKRLVFPTWIFLIIYFFLLLLTGKTYSNNYYLDSFLLSRYGVGYVWIILIYLYSALLIPLFDKMRTLKYSWICIVATYFVFEIAYFFKIGVNNKLLDSTFYYIIPYGMLTYLGFNYHQFSKKAKNTIITIAALVFILCGMFYWQTHGSFVNVQIAKYPPRLYYLSYGILISFLLFKFCEKVELKIYANRLVLFTSRNSMWLYLWHILALYIYDYLKLPQVWYIKFLIVYFVAATIVTTINKLLNLVEKNKKIPLFRYLRY